MTSLPDRLADYPLLAPAERADVDAYVAAHPEWAHDLAVAQGLAAALDRTRAGVRPVDVAEALAGQTRGAALPTDIQDALDADSDLRAEADAIRQRLDALSAAREDPLAHFARLTGRAGPEASEDAGPSDDAEAWDAAETRDKTKALDEASRDAEARETVSPVAGLPPVPLSTAGPLRRDASSRRPLAGTLPADRPAARPARPRRLRLVRLLAYAAAVLVAAYGALFLTSTQRTTERERLADLASLADYEALRLRGGEADDLDDRLDDILDDIDDARRSVLGLFPRYDASALDAVASDLEVVVSAAAPGSSVHEEALFALARVRFAQERDVAARGAFETLVERRGARAPEARRLLDALETIGTGSGAIVR